MPDRGKTIEDLKQLAKDDWILHFNDTDVKETAKAALALLKEQEPKQIVRKQGKCEHSDGSIDYFAEWYCPHCGKLLNRGFDAQWIEFCYKCGNAISWKGV